MKFQLNQEDLPQDYPQKNKQAKPVRFVEYKRTDPKRDKHRKNDYSANRQRKRDILE